MKSQYFQKHASDYDLGPFRVKSVCVIHEKSDPKNVRLYLPNLNCRTNSNRTDILNMLTNGSPIKKLNDITSVIKGMSYQM